MRRTKEDAATSRKAILEAAYEVFMRKGYAATSLSDIAQSINMTRGVIYWHFRSKVDLFVCLVNEAINESFSNAEKIYRSDAPLPDKLKRLLLGDEFGGRLIELLKAFHPAPGELTKVRGATLKAIGEKVNSGFNSFAEFIASEQNAGHIRDNIDVKAFTATLMMITGLMNTPSPNDMNASFLPVAIAVNRRSAIVDMLWNGLGSVFSESEKT